MRERLALHVVEDKLQLVLGKVGQEERKKGGMQTAACVKKKKRGPLQVVEAKSQEREEERDAHYRLLKKNHKKGRNKLQLV